MPFSSRAWWEASASPATRSSAATPRRRSWPTAAECSSATRRARGRRRSRSSPPFASAWPRRPPRCPGCRASPGEPSATWATTRCGSSSAFPTAMRPPPCPSRPSPSIAPSWPSTTSRSGSCSSPTRPPAAARPTRPRWTGSTPWRRTCAVPHRPAVPALAPPPTEASCRRRRGYQDAVRKAKEYIGIGDIFQVVLSRQAARALRRRPLRRLPRACAWSTPRPTCTSCRDGGHLGGGRIARDAGAGGERPGGDAAHRGHAAPRAETPRRTSAWPRSSWPTRRSGPSTSCSWTWAATTSVGSAASAR